MRCLGIALAILSFLIISPCATAANPESRDRTTTTTSREARERAARKACLTADTAKGVELLADLFIDTGDFTYIFNQGRCFEQNRRYGDAIGRFREYLVKAAKLSDEDKADAEKHIEVCQSYLGQSEVAPVATPAPTTPVPQPNAKLEPAFAAVPQAPVVSVVQAQPVSISSEGSGLRIAGVVSASVGAAAVLTGALLSLKVNSMTSDLEKPYNYSRDTDSTRKEYKTLVWVGYGAGAACVAGGALLYYLGWRKAHRSQASLAMVPVVSPGATGALLAGAF